jgi:hypothetical protein
VVPSARPLPLRLAAAFFAFVFWVPSLAVADLVLGLIPARSESSHAAGNLAYGIIGSVLVAPAFASQVRRPERKTAPLQQIALVGLALSLAAVASGAYVGIAGAAVVLVPLVVVLALHPARRQVLRGPRRPSLALVALALAALVPALAYALEMAANGRANLPPEDSYAYVPTVWSATAAMAFATVLIGFLAALRPSGWPIPAASVAVAALLFGTASIINPDIPASGGRGWGAAAILWSIAWVAAATRERKPPGQV